MHSDNFTAFAFTFFFLAFGTHKKASSARMSKFAWIMGSSSKFLRHMQETGHLNPWLHAVFVLHNSLA
jgi:hypothetical protein